MLKLKHLYPNFDLAKEALTSWAHDKENLDEARARFRISGNATYPFYWDGAICFLRLAPTDEKLRDNIAGEIEFILYLRENGYPAAEPLLSLSGEHLLTLETAWGDYFATAFRGVSGVRIDKSDYSEDILFAYGKALGKLRELSSRFVPRVAKWSHEDALHWIGSILEEYRAPASVLTELNTLRTDLSFLSKSNATYGLVHYDFEPDIRFPIRSLSVMCPSIQQVE